MSERYGVMFDALSARGHGAFVPFWMLGDPSPDASLACIDALVRGGADALELGLPFSDPTADGPIVQSAGLRARAAGTTIDGAIDLLAEVRRRHPEIPIGLLVYANLVVAPGISTFYQRMAEAGADSVLVADVPSLEVGPFAAAALEAGVDPILIAPPNADAALIDEIARRSRGYVYVVSRAGVTGIADEIAWTQGDLIGGLRDAGAPPSLIGFGIRTPDDVVAARQQGAAGAISGSAGIALVEEASTPTELVDMLEAWCAQMADAAHRDLDDDRERGNQFDGA